MVNTRLKGRTYELLCKKILTEKGWNVHLCDMPQKFKANQDLWSCFDICALKPEFTGSGKLFVQVKYNCAWKKKVLSDMTEFKARWLKAEDSVQLWNFRRGKGWEIIPV